MYNFKYIKRITEKKTAHCTRAQICHIFLTDQENVAVVPQKIFVLFHRKKTRKTVVNK